LAPTGVAVDLLLSRARAASEMDDDADGGASAIDGVARVVQANIVHLRADSQMRSESEIHAAADAKGKLVGGKAATADTRAADQGLHERIDFDGVAKSQARAKEIGVGIQGNAAGRGVVSAEIAHKTQPPVRVVGDGAAGPVLVDAV